MLKGRRIEALNPIDCIHPRPLSFTRSTWTSISGRVWAPAPVQVLDARGHRVHGEGGAGFSAV